MCYTVSRDSKSQKTGVRERREEQMKKTVHFRFAMCLPKACGMKAGQPMVLLGIAEPLKGRV